MADSRTTYERYGYGFSGLKYISWSARLCWKIFLICKKKKKGNRKDTKGYSRDSPAAKKPSLLLWSWVGPSRFACARKTAHTEQTTKAGNKTEMPILHPAEDEGRCREGQHIGLNVFGPYMVSSPSQVDTYWPILLPPFGNYKLEPENPPKKIRFPLKADERIFKISYCACRVPAIQQTAISDTTSCFLELSEVEGKGWCHGVYLALTASGGRIPGTECSSGEMKYPSWI